MASSGYPGKYEKEHEIKGLESLKERDDVYVFHAGTKYSGGKTVTNGGRVLGVTASSTDLVSAIDKSYKAVNKIDCPNLFCRTDIGKKALKYISG
jgi:phosphoribosylamine--glycine ligase